LHSGHLFSDADDAANKEKIEKQKLNGAFLVCFLAVGPFFNDEICNSTSEIEHSSGSAQHERSTLFRGL